jgi:tetratricopeptide (TPR) repeat protein
MKKYILPVAILVSGISAKAQTLQEAIKKTENERFASAAADFRALIAKDPAKGDYYFYYGENFYNSDNLDSALMMYRKGSEVQPTNGLNYAGMGKVQLAQGNDKEGNANLFKAKTLGAKNATVYMNIAEAYITVPNPYKNLTEAMKLLTDAIKWESKNPEPHLLMGDAILEQNPAEGSGAIKEYNEALKLNPKSPKGLLRIGKLYERGKNYTSALDYYKQAEAIDPNFAPAYREKAEIYNKAGMTQKALESIKKYMELNNNSMDARKRYAEFLFKAKQYPDAIKELEEILKKDPTSYLWRLLGYSYDEMDAKTDKEAPVKGVDAMNKFFEVTGGKNYNYIPDDYRHLGSLLGKTGKDSLGAVAILKAIALDTVKNCELYGEVARIYMKAKKYDKATYYYERKATCPNMKDLTSTDWFELGRAYFYIGAAKIKEAAETKDAKAKAKKEAEALPYFVKADTAFAHVCRLTEAVGKPFSTGYFWRGKASINIDPKNDLFLAKPHFEKALSLVKPEERAAAGNKDNVILACEYLGYYYVKMKDNAKAKEYWNIVKELDPNNEKAKAFFKSPEGK